MTTVTVEHIAAAVEAFTTKSAAEIRDLKAEQSELNEAYKSVSQSLIELAQKSGGAGIYAAGLQATGPGAGAVLGKALADERIAAFRSDRGIKSASVTLNSPLKSLLSVKNLVVGDAASSTADLFNVQPQRDPRLGEFPTRPLTLLQALPHLPVGSNAFEFNALDGYLNQAAIQAAEGADMGQTDVATELVTAKIATIGHYVRLSEQVVADSPALLAQMQALLGYGVQAKATREMIAGTGSVIVGLQSQAGAYIAASDTPMADAIGGAMTALSTAGWNPDLVVMHPNDWHLIRSERTFTEQAYVAGGWATPAQPTIWGAQVIVDPAVTQQKPLVLDRSQAMILDRQDARVELGRSGNGFVEGIVDLRAIIRVGLAVFSPSAVLEVTVP